jgi:hypothetical protein
LDTVRRLAVSLLSVAGLAALAPVASAAPRATDFSQPVALGGAATARAAGGSVVTAPQRARGRFDLVGLTWRDRDGEEADGEAAHGVQDTSSAGPMRSWSAAGYGMSSGAWSV